MARSGWKTMAVFAALLLLWAAVQFHVWTPVGLERDSFVYRIKVPARAKRVQLWNPDDAPTYDRGISAGFAPDNTLIRYRSKSALGALASRATSEGYACQRLGELVLTCDRSVDARLESQMTARYEPRTGRTEVAVYVPD